MDMAFSVVKGLAKIATGTADTAAPGDQESGKLEAFYTSLATYPFLHLSTIAPAHIHLPHEFASQPSTPPRSHDAYPASNTKSPAKRPGSTPGSSNVLGSLVDYPEGKALVTLEKCYMEPVTSQWIMEQLFWVREWLVSNLSTLDPDHSPLLLEKARLERIACGTPRQPQEGQTAELAAGTTPPEANHVRPGDTLATQWLIWIMHQLIAALNLYLGPRPPYLPSDQVVKVVLQCTAGRAEGKAGTGALGLEGGLPNPVARLEEAVKPNVRTITREQSRKFVLNRNKTWLERVNTLLGVVRWWLYGVARAFYLLAVWLRILGNGLSALGGLVAFTVVLSIAISVLSALTFLAASAADASGTFTEYMARFTDLAKRRSGAGAAGQAKDRLGPRSVGPLTSEDLEDFVHRQLVLRRPMPGRRTRPDVPRLAHSKLLVKCYDLGLVDNTGALLPSASLEDITEHFDPAGFFGYASPRTKKAAALMLLRQLASRYVKSIMSPPSTPGEVERALRYVFLAGLRECGAPTLYRSLTGMPHEYSSANLGALLGEMRPILGHHSSYALLCTAESEPSASGKRPSGTLAHPHRQWITQPSHGIISCLMFVVDVDTRLEQVGLAPVVGGAGEVLGNGSGAGGGVVQEHNAYAPLGQHAPGAGGPGSQALDMVWQALAVHRPVLFAINKATVMEARLQEDPDTSERCKGYWRSALREEANRRGLESELMSVQLTELLHTPPLGAAGLTQVQDWLAQVLADAPAVRCP